MIWLRRILAIPLMIIFVVIFVLSLLLSHLSGTVGSAGFYNGQMRKAEVYEWVYRDLMPAVLDEAAEQSSSGSPFDTPEMRKDIVEVAESAFPPAWMQLTFESASKKVVPYIVDDKKSLVVNVDVRSRIDPMAEGIKGVVDKHKLEIYDYTTDGLIVPALTDNLGTSTHLPYGIVLTNEEINAALKAAMTENWTITQFKGMIDSMADYMKGDSSTLDMTVDLTAVNASAAASFLTLVDTKLQAEFDSIPPTCNEVQFLAQLSSLPPNTLPSCRPSGYTYAQFKQALETKMGMTFAQVVEQNVTSQIPGSYQFNDAQLREALGEDLAGTLDSAREFIVEDHGQITDQDLRGSDNGSSGAEEKAFDDARHTIHTIKMWIWALWLVAILLLVAIGFLCGRNWKSRLLWPLCVLFVTSLVLVILVAVGRSVAPISDRMVERPEGPDATQVSIVIADKGDEIAHNAVNAIIGGFEGKLILFTVFSGLAMVAVIVWMIVDRRRHQEPMQDDPRVPLSRE